jgi:hypothetical protein
LSVVFSFSWRSRAALGMAMQYRVPLFVRHF